MMHRAALRHRAPIAFGASLLITSLLLATSGTISSASSNTVSSRPIATTVLNPDSLCSPDFGDNVSQQWNGDYEGCFRVPDLKASSAIVALQGFVMGLSDSSPEPTTTLATAAPNVSIELSASTSSVTPGEEVVLTGRVSQKLTPKQKQPSADLCWDGCGGLVEQGVIIHWLSSKKFQVTLHVPQTAWLVAKKGGLSVHPLTSGKYEVGVQCLVFRSGCGLRGAEAKVALQLKAPTPQRCVNGKPCESLIVAPKIATVGDEVMVSGWAPVYSSIGAPWSYSISVTQGPAKKSYPGLAYGPTKLNGSFNVVLAPTALKIGQSPPWSKLGTIPYVSSTFSGPSALSPSSNSTQVAWCRPSGIAITGGAEPIHVPTTGVRSALRGTTLHMAAGARAVPQCTAVQLDPKYSNTIYGGFDSEEGNSIPPVYLAPMYSTNLGASWHVVPVPQGVTIEDFSGFEVDGDSVEALFGTQQSYNATVGTHGGLVTAEVTANGGSTWSASTLGCPASGPCMTFGPYVWGYCNMSNDEQGLLLGPPGSTATSGIKWTTSTWVTSVNSCFSQQLVVSSSSELFLLDPSSEYPLLRSTDGGRVWTNWSLPSIATANYGPDSTPITNSLVLAPDGSLFASITTPNESSQELYRLYPGAKSWCEMPHAFGSAAPDNVQPLHVDATDLLWSESSPTSDHAVAYSSLTC